MDPPAEETVTPPWTGSDLGAIAEVQRRRTERRRRERRRRADDGSVDDGSVDDGSVDDGFDVAASDAPREVLTPLGRLLSQLPLDPATGRMLIMGAVAQCLDPVLTAAACMSSRDPFIVPTGMRDEAQRARRSFCETSDHLAVLRAYVEWRAVIEDGFDAACRWARDILSIQGLHPTSLRSQLLGELTRTGLVHSGIWGTAGDRPASSPPTGVNRHASNEPLVTAVLLTGLPGNLRPGGNRRPPGDAHATGGRAGLHPGCVRSSARRPGGGPSRRVPSGSRTRRWCSARRCSCGTAPPSSRSR